MTIIPDAPTSAKIMASGASATEYSGGVSMVPTTALNKTQLSTELAAMQPMSAYDEPLALGADPADVAGFRDVGNTPTHSATKSAKKKSGTVSPYSNTGGGTQVSNPPACVDQSFDGGHGHVYNGPGDGSRSTNAVDRVYDCGSCSYLPTVSATWWYTTS